MTPVDGSGPGPKELYVATSAHHVHNQAVRWTAIYNFLVCASILALAWATVYTNPALTWGIFVRDLLAAAGCLLSLAFVFLGARANRFAEEMDTLGRELEEGERGPFHRAAMLRTRLRWYEDIVSSARALTLLPLVFLLVFVGLLVVEDDSVNRSLSGSSTVHFAQAGVTPGLAWFMFVAVASCIAGFVARAGVGSILAPRLEFSRRISRVKHSGTGDRETYQVQLANHGQREIVDVRIRAELRFRTVGATVLAPREVFQIPVEPLYIPALLPKQLDGIVELVRLKLDDSEWFRGLSPMIPQSLRTKLEAGTASLDEVFQAGSGATLSMIAFGYDSFAGVRKKFCSLEFSVESIEEVEP